ncbi:MAG: FAD-dependent monooxygenase [Burkholderiales bacterium]|nr:FAD-dependent monooxygenase [Burkholderiales bacterium]
MSAPRVLIAGAGPVGLTAGLALRGAGCAVEIFDSRCEGEGDGDPRAIALAHGSALILDRLDVALPESAAPIQRIEISQQHGFGRAGIDAAAHQLGALGHVVRLGELTRVLRHKCQATGMLLRFGARLPDEPEDEVALVVHAEGSTGDCVVVRDYGQTAVVTEARSDRAPAHTAFERFTPAGPLALLPMGTGHSVVWCVKPERADELCTCSEAAFIAALDTATRFAGITWRSIGTRTAYALKLSRRTQSDADRQVWIGNAAQTLHPVAGQGLNLGLRDAYELGAALADGVNEAQLSRWRARRRKDRDAIVRLTDGYVSLFSNDLGLLRIGRGLGLTMLDTLPPLKGLVARHMMFGAR